jgi:uncharacterized protein YegL
MTAPRPRASDDRPRQDDYIIPFYAMFDESERMMQATISALNRSLAALRRDLTARPNVAEVARVCLISFADEARIRLPLTDVRTVAAMPILTHGGGTQYGPALALLIRTIHQDANRLKRFAITALRPTVFFVSGSPPRDDWHQSHLSLLDHGWRLSPNIVAFGVGQADESVIRTIATTTAYCSSGRLPPTSTVRNGLAAAIFSIVEQTSQSTLAAPDRQLCLMLPTEVPGFVAHRVGAVRS